MRNRGRRDRQSAAAFFLVLTYFTHQEFTVTSRTKVVFSDQYNVACVSVESADWIDPDALIAECQANGAIRNVDGTEYCVELREDIGPELWTEESLRRSVGKKLR